MAEELATPKHEDPCSGGFKTRPYTWTFTLSLRLQGNHPFKRNLRLLQKSRAE